MRGSTDDRRRGWSGRSMGREDCRTRWAPSRRRDVQDRHGAGRRCKAPRPAHVAGERAAADDGCKYSATTRGGSSSARSAALAKDSPQAHGLPPEHGLGRHHGGQAQVPRSPPSCRIASKILTAVVRCRAMTCAYRVLLARRLNHTTRACPLAFNATVPSIRPTFVHAYM